MPARAADPYGLTASRRSRSRIRSPSRSSGQAWASRWWDSRIGCACWRWVRPGIGTPSCRSRLIVQRQHHLGTSGRDLPQRVAQVHPDQGGDLVVARPPGPEPATKIHSDDLDQTALQGAVHVLVGRRPARTPPTRPPVQAGPARRSCPPARPRSAGRPGAGPGRGPGIRRGRSGPAASRTGSTDSARTSPRPVRRRTGRPRAVPSASGGSDAQSGTPASRRAASLLDMP